MIEIRSFAQLTDERRREAASLLLAHHAAEDRQEAIEQFLAAVVRREIDPEPILTAWLHDCVVGIQAVEIIGGRSAAFWAVRARPGNERIGVEDLLIQQAIENARAASVKVIQCLVPTGEEAPSQALKRNGFVHITRVQQRLASTEHAAAPRGADVSFVPFEFVDAKSFRRILDESFADTLDCPELNGLRTPDEVFAGYLASAPDLNRWWLVCHLGTDVGVLILADASSPECWDIAYVGVIPTARRKGIARATIGFALSEAAAAGKAGLSLIVDERNRPAIGLYERAGFQVVAERDVYLFS